MFPPSAQPRSRLANPDGSITGRQADSSMSFHCEFAGAEAQPDCLPLAPDSNPVPWKKDDRAPTFTGVQQALVVNPFCSICHPAIHRRKTGRSRWPRASRPDAETPLRR